MAAIAKNDALPFVRTLSLDPHPVLKIQFWPNKTYGSQAAVITSHGCWTVNFSSSQPGITQYILNLLYKEQLVAWHAIAFLPTVQLLIACDSTCQNMVHDIVCAETCASREG